MKTIRPLPVGDFAELMTEPAQPYVPSKARIAELVAALNGEPMISIALTPYEFDLLLTLVTPERAEHLREIAAERSA
jgi:hypothetical protein